MSRYKVANEKDIDAKNMFALLNIGDEALEIERRAYINRHKNVIGLMNESAQTYFNGLLEPDPTAVQFPRAIEEEFNIKLAL